MSASQPTDTQLAEWSHQALSDLLLRGTTVLCLLSQQRGQALAPDLEAAVAIFAGYGQGILGNRRLAIGWSTRPAVPPSTG